jgi:carbon monoxide dehydrogenase subunit G
VAGWIAALAVLLPVTVHGATVKVERCRARGDSVDVVMSVDVAAPPAVMWRVLTDYERMTRFVPGLRRAKRVGVTAEGPVIEHVGVTRVLFVGRTVRALVQMHEVAPIGIRFRSLAGDIPRLSGAWRIQPLPGSRTRLRYTCQAATGLRLPSALLAWMARQESLPRIRALGREAERQARLARPSAVGAGPDEMAGARAALAN